VVGSSAGQPHLYLLPQNKPSEPEKMLRKLSMTTKNQGVNRRRILQLRPALSAAKPERLHSGNPDK
jgi:hypothetical protein